MVDLGFNYRISDFQCALGLSQLNKLTGWIAGRLEIAAHYDAAFGANPAIRPLRVRTGACHAYHLYVVRVAEDRQQIFRALRERGIGANVHYVPVHLHPFYRHRFGTGAGLCPVAEAAYERILSLPIFPGMSDTNVEHVIAAMLEVTG